MSKVVKGVKNAVKKVFKAVTKTKLGRAILIGATVYLGGAALGMWKAAGPLAKVNGIFAGGGGGGAATQAGALGSGGSSIGLAPGAGVAAPGVAGGGAVTQGQALANSLIPAGVGSGTAPVVGGGSALGLAPGAGVAATGGALAPGVAPAAAASTAVPVAKAVVEPGIISKMMAGTAKAAGATADFVQAHPMPSAMLVNGLSAALSPNQMDVMREQTMMQREMDEEDRRRREANMNVSGVNVSRPGGTGQMSWVSTGQPIYNSGLIYRGMRA